jgi:hypothetical protein
MAKSEALSSRLLTLSHTHPNSQGHGPNEASPLPGARADHGEVAEGLWGCLQSMSNGQRAQDLKCTKSVTVK